MNRISDLELKILKRKIELRDNDKIEISVFGASRGRTKLLKTSILNLYGLAKYPEKIEYLLRVDDDDKETIDFLLEDEELKIFRNLRIFIGPRVGYKYIYKTWVQLMRKCIGDIFLPFADDCGMILKEWDDILYPYKGEEAVIIFFRKRMAFTKIAYEKHKIISEWANRTMYTDSIIYKYSINNNICVKEKKIWERYQPDDFLFKESHGGWELEDLTILDNLPLIELYRYGE